MPSSNVTIRASSDYALSEATQKALKDNFKSFPGFDGTKGFKYYEYDFNSQKFKDLDGNDHPEQLKVIFPRASIDSSDVYAQHRLRTSYIDKEFLELGIFPKLSRTDGGYDICVYYDNFQNLTNCESLRFPHSWYFSLLDSAFVIYIGEYSNLHYFVVLVTRGYSPGYWIVTFDATNKIIAQVGDYFSSSFIPHPYSRIYKHFDSSNGIFQLFYFGISGLDANEIFLNKITINFYDSSYSTSYFILPTPEYLINNKRLFVVNTTNNDNRSLITSRERKYFAYYFEDPIKAIASQTVSDVLLFSFWDPVSKPEELTIALIPFTLDLSTNTVTYNLPVEKKYNPLQITPEIYKHTSEEELIYVAPPNNNYDYLIDRVSVKLDDLTLILRNFNEENFNFEVVGYKTLFDSEPYNNQHSVITVDYCYNSVCKNVYSMYYGVGGFYGHYLITKKSDRFLFAFVPQIYQDSNNNLKHASVTYVYDLQFPLPDDYEPPSSETDIPRIARNPWFVEFTHPGLKRWELLSNDETHGPIYRNSKKSYLWGNVLVNYPSDGEFVINMESLYRGDGFLYPRNVLLALPALQDFSQTFVGSLHSPFATGSFLFFKDVKSTQPLDSDNDFTLKYIYSPDLSSFSFIASQGSSKIPIAIFSILDDKEPRLYEWFNIYGNIAFFNTRRAFAPSRGFLSGNLLKPPNLPPNGSYKKVANFYPLFSLDFPKLFSNLYRVVTFSSYIDGKDVKVKTIKSRYITQDSRIAVNFYFYPDAPQRYEVRGVDGTGNFYFTVLNQANFLFLPAHYIDTFEIGDTITINSNGVSYAYEIIDIDTFTDVIVDDSVWPWDFNVYLLMLADSIPL